MPLELVCAVAELPPGTRKIIATGRIGIGIFNVAGAYFAYRNICPHAGAPVCEGAISGTTLPSQVYEYNVGHENCILRCPWHGWEFDLRTGEHLVDPEMRLKKIPIGTGAASPTAKGENLDKFPVEITDGQIYVRLPG